MMVCTRRRALWMGGAFAASGPLAGLARGLPYGKRTPDVGSRLYAVVRSHADTAIAHFVWSGAAWQQRQSFTAAGAGPLLAGASARYLVVGLAARDARDAAGSVETLHVDARTGLLTRGVPQALALSAREPSALAFAPDGRMLAVAAAGGVLSLLPVHASGQVGEVIAAYKHLALAPCAGGSPVLTFPSKAELHVRSAAQNVRFLFDESGLRCVESLHEPYAPASHAALPSRATPGVPEGVVSSVLLPPMSV